MQALRETIDVVLKRAERNVLMLLAGPLAHETPVMGRTAGGERETRPALGDIEAELGIEGLRVLQVRNDEMEVVDRMDAEFARAASRMDISLDLGHGAFLLFAADLVAIRRIFVPARIFRRLL